MEIRTAKLVESYALLICFAVFGAASAALGASYPQLSKDIDNDGVLTFSVLGRGLGFLCGLLTNLYVIGTIPIKWHMWSIVGLNIFSAMFTFALAFVSDMPQYQVWLIVFPFLQGFGFSSCDALGNTYLFTIWKGDEDANAGKLGSCCACWIHWWRSYWSSALGSLKYRAAFIVIALISLFPLAGLVLAHSMHGAVVQEVPQEEKNEASTAVQYRLSPVLVFLLQLFFFFLMGQEMVCSVWIATYVIDSGISDSESTAAYAGSAFYAAMLVGRLCMATFPYIKRTANPILLQNFVCAQLAASALLLVYGFTLRYFEQFDYAILVIVVVFFGFSINSLIGMGINTVEDYKCLQQNPNLVVKEMIGLSIGEVSLPALVGVIFFAVHPYTLMKMLMEQEKPGSMAEPLL